MLDLFVRLASLCQVLFDFCANMVGSLIDFFKFLVASVPLVFSFTGLMPSIIGTCVWLVVFCALVKAILRR